MSEVRRLWFEGPAGRLEAMVRVANPARACALVAHPHPLHGGTMHNPVVFHADRELHRTGMTTLRFNFRGVGTSEGVHDEGRGETEDLAAAAAWLRGLAPGKPQIVVGFSFGSWCAYRHLLADPSADAFVAIGLPVTRYPFAEIGDLAVPIAVVQGEHDEFGAPGAVREVLRRASPEGRLVVVDGAPHLFPGRASEAGAAVVRAVEDLLDAPAR